MNTPGKVAAKGTTVISVVHTSLPKKLVIFTLFNLLIASYLIWAKGGPSNVIFSDSKWALRMFATSEAR